MVFILLMMLVPPLLMGALPVARIIWEIRTFASTPGNPVSVPEAIRIMFFGYPHTMAFLTLSVSMAVAAAAAVAAHVPEPIASLLSVVDAALILAPAIAFILERRALLRMARRVTRRHD